MRQFKGFKIIKDLVWFALALWHINFAKSICIHINSSISINSVLYKFSFNVQKSYFKQFSLAYKNSSISSNSVWYKYVVKMQTYKWYMHKPASVLENEMHKILLDFEIQTDHLISAWRLGLVIVKRRRKKENQPFSGLCRSSGSQSNNQRKRNVR